MEERREKVVNALIAHLQRAHHRQSSLLSTLTPSQLSQVLPPLAIHTFTHTYSLS